MTGRPEVDTAIRRCQGILRLTDEPYVLLVFEEHGCHIVHNFCCDFHMKENAVGILSETAAANEH